MNIETKLGASSNQLVDNKSTKVQERVTQGSNNSPRRTGSSTSLVMEETGDVLKKQKITRLNVPYFNPRSISQVVQELPNLTSLYVDVCMMDSENERAIKSIKGLTLLSIKRPYFACENMTIVVDDHYGTRIFFERANPMVSAKAQEEAQEWIQDIAMRAQLNKKL